MMPYSNKYQMSFQKHKCLALFMAYIIHVNNINNACAL